MKPTSHYLSRSNSMDRLAAESDAESYKSDDGFGGSDFLLDMLRDKSKPIKGTESGRIEPKQVRDERQNLSDLTQSRTQEFEQTLPEGWRKARHGRAEEYEVPGEGHLAPQFGGRASSEPAEDNPFMNPNTGEPAKYGYRWEGPEGIKHMEETGNLVSKFGGANEQRPYTHVSMFPDSRYRDSDKRLLQVDVNQPGHVNRVKDHGYGVISSVIPSEQVRDVTDTYDGPTYQSAEKWETTEPPDDWYETQGINRAYDMTNVAVADAANEATKQMQEGVMTPAKGREFWRGMK